MTEQVIVRRYAQVLYDWTGGDAYEDMELIHATVHASPELSSCLESPVVHRSAKAAALHSVFEEQVGATTLRFLQFLVDRKREILLGPIAAQYQDIRDASMGVTRVHVRVPTALSAQKSDQMQKTLEERLDMKVRLKVEQDRDLIGGIVLRIGNTVYDGSLNNQLTRLRKRISN